MTLVQLQYLISVAKYGNFTVAAEKSFATQPTLSMQIQKLESELGVLIFDRTSHPFKLTKIGEKVVEQAKEILSAAKNMQQIVEEEKNATSGQYTLGIIPTVLPTLVPLFLKVFQEKFPKIKLIIKELKTQDIISQLNDDQIDFGIAATPLLEKNIVEDKLYYEPLLAYIPPSDPLSKKKIINQKELENADVLLLEEGHCFRNSVLNICSNPRYKDRNLNIDSGSFNTLVKLANDGYGMTILPSLHSESLCQEDKQNLKNFESPIPMREISLLYHKNQLRLSFAVEIKKTILGLIRGKLFLESDNITHPTLRLP